MTPSFYGNAAHALSTVKTLNHLVKVLTNTVLCRIGQMRKVNAYLVRARSEHEQIKWNCGDHVNDEPAFQVMDGDLCRMTDYLLLLVDVRRPKVDEDVNDKHDVDDQVYYSDWIVITTESRTP